MGVQGDPKEAIVAIQAEVGAWTKVGPVKVVNIGQVLVGFEREASRYSNSLHAV